MVKHYSSDTQIALNVVLANGKSLHITFTALSNGSSVYATEVEEVQEALEKHYRFGSLFRLDRVEGEVLEDEDIEMEQETEENQSDNSSVESEAEGEVRKVVVHDLGEAKNYLAETFGVSRTALKSKKAILEAAIVYGVEFEGID